MGLFDSYQFDPQSYGGSQRGLLANLLPQIQYENPQGLGFGTPETPLQYGQTSNVAVGNYQMPVFGQGDPATIPTSAQPTSGPAPQQQADPSVGDRLNGFLNGYSNNRDRGVLGGLVSAISGFSSGNAPENQTVKSLVARGLDQNTAQLVARDPSLLRSVLPQLMGTAGKTDDIKEFEYARTQGFTGGLQEWMQRKRGGAGEYGMTPIWGVDKDGKPAIVQLGKSGDAKQSGLPDGFSISRDPIKVEGPTGTTILDPQTRQVVSFIPKDLKGAEIQKIEGEAQGNAKVNLPNVLAKSQQTLDIIDKMISHPGRETATGLSGTLDPRNYLGGTDAKNFQIAARQLEGKTFLEAFESLKGAGAITEMEGSKATAAIARLDRAQSDTEYLAALKELKTIVSAGMERAKTKAAGGSPQAGAAATAPAGPSVDELLKKYGG